MRAARWTAAAHVASAAKIESEKTAKEMTDAFEAEKRETPRKLDEFLASEEGQAALRLLKDSGRRISLVFLSGAFTCAEDSWRTSYELTSDGWRRFVAVTGWEPSDGEGDGFWGIEYEDGPYPASSADVVQAALDSYQLQPGEILGRIQEHLDAIAQQVLETAT